MSFLPSDTYHKSQPKGRHVKGREKPPFLVSDQRFSDRDVGLNSKNSPEYHCAYSSTADKPNRWDTKGWTAIDDAIKPKRGTSTGKLHSSMAPSTSPPAYGASIQPLHAMYPNETRLQELLELQRRKMQRGAPSPGTYEVHLPPRRSTFRRPNHPELDGPYFLGEGEDGHLAVSTRGKEIAALIRNAGDSGVGPGEYSPDVLAKEVTSQNRSPPKIKIGTSCRDGRAPPRAKSLSVSRSIQHGVNYHVPVIVRTPGEFSQQDKEPLSRSATSGEFLGHRDTAASGSLEDGVSVASPSPHATGSPPRYMEPIHDTSPNRPPRPVKLLPPPPANVMRAGIPRGRSKQPGDWDWNKLGHNFRTTWTTSGGGAYSHGDRKHERRSTSPKATSSQDPAAGGSHLSSLWPAFGPESSSIDITKLPNTHSPIFPIPEDASFNRDISSSCQMSKLSSQRASPPQQPLPPKADSRTSSSSSMYPSSSRHATPTTGIEAHMEMQRPQGSNNSSSNHTNSAGAAGGDVGAWGGGGPPDESESGQKGHQLRKSNSLLDLPGAANVLVTPVERERHNQAQQAASVVQQINARQSDWMARSTPPSSSQGSMNGPRRF